MPAANVAAAVGRHTNRLQPFSASAIASTSGFALSCIISLLFVAGIGIRSFVNPSVTTWSALEEASDHACFENSTDCERAVRGFFPSTANTQDPQNAEDVPFSIPLSVLPDDTDKGVCLDGSPPAYHYSPGWGEGARKWVVFLEGGGWCTDGRDCRRRSRSRLGSSSKMGAIPFGGILSNSSTINPFFYNWNAVFVRYCDGSSFAGTTVPQTTGLKKEGVFVDGQRVFERVVHHLLHARGMKTATHALLGGCSAGGLAAILHCDQFKQMLTGLHGTPDTADGIPDSAGEESGPNLGDQESAFEERRGSSIAGGVRRLLRMTGADEDLEDASDSSAQRKEGEASFDKGNTSEGKDTNDEDPEVDGSRQASTGSKEEDGEEVTNDDDQLSERAAGAEKLQPGDLKDGDVDVPEVDEGEPAVQLKTEKKHEREGGEEDEEEDAGASTRSLPKEEETQEEELKEKGSFRVQATPGETDLPAPSSGPIVKCLSDAGFFPNVKDVLGMRTLKQMYTRVLDFHHPQLSPSCLEKEKDDPEDDGVECFFAEDALKHVSTPLFVLNPLYDLWLIRHAFVPESKDMSQPWADCRKDLRKCSAEQLRKLHSYRKKIIESVEDAQEDCGTRTGEDKCGGVFLNSCQTHCQSTSNLRWNGPGAPRVGNKTMSDAIAAWYNGDEGVHVTIDCEYPCNPSCLPNAWTY